MKRWIIALVMILSLYPVSCLAEELPLAAPYNIMDEFCDQPGFSMNVGDSTWEYIPYEICAAHEYISKNVHSIGTLSGFYFSVLGEVETGLLFPILNVIYRDKSVALKAYSVSFLIHDTRFDFVCDAKDATIGNVDVEMMRIPLDDAGIYFWNAVYEATEISMQIYGEKTYSTTFQVIQSPSTPRQYLANAWLKGSATLHMQLKTQAFPDSYLLWDLNRSAYESHWGTTPIIETIDLSWATEEEPFLQNLMGVLSIGSNGKSVKKLQDLLSERGFYIGPSDGSFRKDTKEAILLAQQHYRMPCTGFADRRLLNALNNIQQVDSAPSLSSSSGISFAVEQMNLICTRYWFASTVRANKAQNPLGSYERKSADEVLLIVDGNAKNNTMNYVISDAEYEVYFQIGEYAVSAVLLFETNDHTHLSNAIGPLVNTRFVIVASIPKSLAGSTPMMLYIRTESTEREIVLN